ncbi:stage V sporulation protein B [Alicyclobacillus contaminans]|uniref:putative polysaccharide biosynthesis protein n=1 Tax=Alicyclobacillus contaminans TaxID=392016 RepID=UPI00041FC83B|nr:polysaccharide biosynthesis protein [Alicyclobacillus contaminans]GMA50526.1 stage V sporulation protein B [Alicyclobacillus contaminans]
MPQRHGFVYGALLLALAAVVSKLLGSVYTIVLQNVMGDQGMGLFQMAYPVYATLLAVATAGFPVAISKMVSERVALGDEYGVRQVFRMAVVLLSALGAGSFVLLYGWADAWAKLAGDPAAAWAIRAIAPALLVVPALSALRGYFQGYQWMQPTAASQVVEQVVRVMTILGLAIWLTAAGFGKEMAAAGAAFGAVTGALAGLLMMVGYWLRQQQTRPVGRRPDSLSGRTLAKQLLLTAFPISLGALVVPLMNNVDVVTVVNLLKHTGETQVQATTDFGLLTGRAFKLMMLPTTLAAGIGVAVMPAVSEAFTLGFRGLVSDRVDTAIRLTVLIALPAGIGLLLLAGPVDVALFKDAAGVDVIQAMACATVFASLQTTVAAVLQGAGWMYLPVLNLLLASAVKLCGNLLLVPGYGIRGAAWATVFSYAVATLLNFVALRHRLHLPLHWRGWFARPALATFIMGAAVFAMERQWRWMGGMAWGRMGIAAASGIMVGIAIAIYAVALLVTGSVRQQDVAAIPRIGPRLAAWCQRLGWLNP